jgi:hypothetical protein
MIPVANELLLGMGDRLAGRGGTRRDIRRRHDAPAALTGKKNILEMLILEEIRPDPGADNHAIFQEITALGNI